MQILGNLLKKGTGRYVGFFLRFPHFLVLLAPQQGTWRRCPALQQPSRTMRPPLRMRVTAQQRRDTVGLGPASPGTLLCRPGFSNERDKVPSQASVVSSLVTGQLLSRV